MISAVRVSPNLTVLPKAVSNGGGASDRLAAGAVLAGAPPPSSARNAAIMAAGTTLSRFSGFARVLAVAWALGQGTLSDAYNQANTVPNTIYELLLGGVLSATLLPVLMQSLARYDKGDDDSAVPAVTTFLTICLVAGTVVFWLAAPFIIDFYFLAKGTGSGTLAEKALATSWLRLFAPQLLFIGLTAITTALLNAKRRLGSIAFSPVLANVVTIAALVIADHLVPHGSVDAYRRDTTALAVVGIGTTAGYLAQLLAQLPALFKAGVPLRVHWGPRHPALKTIGRLSGWTVGAVIANQVSFTLVTVLFLKTGGNYSAFSYAYAFVLLPHAVLAVSIAYAVAPDLAALWSTDNRERFANRVSQALRTTLALVLPAAVGYALVARPVVTLALAHGNFRVSSAHLTWELLVILALGLPGFSTYLLLMRAFQSKQDTRSMFWLYVLENGITVVAALALFPFFGAKGLTAAWIGAYTVALPFAWRRLGRSAQISLAPGWLLRAIAATAAMAAVVATAVHVVPAPSSLALSTVRLFLIVALGGLTFLFAARSARMDEVAGLWARLRASTR